MANLPRALAEEVGKARAAGGGNWIQHGDYTLMLEKASYTKIQDECIIFDFRVIESRKKTVFFDQKPITVEPHPVGSTCSEVINFDGKGKQSAGANARKVILGLFGLKEGDKPDAEIVATLDEVIGPAQPAKGMLVRLSTYAHKKRSNLDPHDNDKNFITGKNWECVAQPRSGLNTVDLASLRLQALARSPEDMVKVTLEQMNQFRQAPLPMNEIAAAPIAAPAMAAPSLPSIPPPVPSLPVVDPFAGWQQHPQDANFYFNPVTRDVKSKADLLAAAQRL